MSAKTLGVLVLVFLIVLGSYGFYVYAKQTPPSWLIKLVTATKPPPPLPAGDIAPFDVPEGFVATIYSRETPGARVLIRDPKGTMVVSSTKEGTVLALPDENSDGVAEYPIPILKGLNQPHGISFICKGEECSLYVAETDALKRYAYDSTTRTASYIETVMTFPSGSGHFTRTLWQSPNNEDLLVSIGSSCNVCDETEPLRATIAALNLATGNTRVIATGLRNSVFMTTHPVTGAVWASENGRDLIGDDIPPDEVNIIEEGKSYGWPICYGKGIHDTDFDKKQYVRDPCTDSIPSHLDLQAHSAALGLAFVPEEGWPEEMWHDLLIAYHGSWNRGEPTGYKVVRIELTPEGQPLGGTPLDFMTGFLAEGAQEDEALGRPAGLLVEPGGTVYVSDDRAGAVYKVSWTGE